MSAPTIFLSAGEASGEHYGALLLAALQQRLKAQNCGAARFFGMGGQRMRDAGLDCVVRAEDMAVMGLTEVVRHLPRVYREFLRLQRSLRHCRPSVAVLIDFPEVHFRLARTLHRLGTPVIYFVSPQLWAWKKHRIRLVRKYVDRMLVIFPFEEAFYRAHGVSAEFVGHPLAELPLPAVSRADFAARHALDPARTWIGLLPGSRAREIHDTLPEMLAAARRLAQGSTAPGAQFVIPLAPTLTAAQRRTVEETVQSLGSGLAIRLVGDAEAAAGARAVLHHARASVVASGTATIEAALIGNPFVVVYRVSPLTYAIAKRVVTVKDVAMPNLIAGRRIVPELIQNDFTAENIVQHIEPLLSDGPPRASMMAEFRRLRALLHTHPATGGGTGGAIDRVAEITLETLGALSPAAESVSS